MRSVIVRELEEKSRCADIPELASMACSLREVSAEGRERSKKIWRHLTDCPWGSWDELNQGQFPGYNGMGVRILRDVVRWLRGSAERRAEFMRIIPAIPASSARRLPGEIRSERGFRQRP